MRTVISLTVVLVLVLGLAGAGWWYFHASQNQGPELRTEAVAQDDLLATISATGTLEPEDVVDVGAQVGGMIQEFGLDVDKSNPRLMPALAGRTVGLLAAQSTGPLLASSAALNANELPIDYGSKVGPGTVLARIDDAIYRAKVEQSRANVQYAEADLKRTQAIYDQARKDWNRNQPLISSGAITASDGDQYLATYRTNEATVAVAAANVAKAKAALHQDEVNLGYCTIKSTVQGVVIDRRVTIGQTVQSSFSTPSLFLLAKDLKRMKVWASVNEADISQIRPGQTVTFTVDARPDETFHGVVDQIRLNASMTQNVVTYTVEVFVDNAAGRLLPYMTANLKFEVDRRSKVLLISNSALRWRPQPQQVAQEFRDAFVSAMKKKDAGDARPTTTADAQQKNKGIVWVKDGEFVKPVKVRLGLSDGNRTEVREGDLHEGDHVVIGEMVRSSGDNSTNPFAPQVFGGKKQQ